MLRDSPSIGFVHGETKRACRYLGGDQRYMYVGQRKLARNCFDAICQESTLV